MLEASTVYVALFLLGVLAFVLVPGLAWVERRQGALMQDRIGANRASIAGLRLLGLLQPLADAIGAATREDVTPRGSSRSVRALAPFLAVTPILAAFAVLPFGGSYSAWGAEWRLVVADLDYGILYVFALASIATYGAALAGLASNSNPGSLASLRVWSQLISSRVALGASLIGVFMICESLRLTEIGAVQQGLFRPLGFVEHLGWAGPQTFWIDAIQLPMWGIVLQPLAFVLFLTAILAERGLPPFDGAGHLVEYGGGRLGLFRLAEHLHVVLVAGLATALFLGGWSLPWISDGLLIGGLTQLFGPNLANVVAMSVHVAVFFAKLLVLIFLLVAIRWSLPRFRSDQIVHLGWKILLPLAVANLVATALGIRIVAEVVG